MPAGAVRAFALVLTLGLGSFSQAWAATVTYQVEPHYATFVVHLLKEGIGAAFAHEHVIRAGAYSGSIRIDPADPRQGAVAIIVDARFLQADEPRLRQEYGLDAISDGDRRKISDTMHSKKQLDTKRYPRITFHSKRIKPLEGDRYWVMGELTIRGRSQLVSLPVTARLRGGRLIVRGQLRFRQSLFGYKPYSAGLGAVRVKDEAILNIYLQARPR